MGFSSRIGQSRAISPLIKSVVVLSIAKYWAAKPQMAQYVVSPMRRRHFVNGLLLQRSQCAGLRGGRHRSADRDGTPPPPPTARRTLRPGPAAARAADTTRGDGASAANAGGQDAVRPAQAHPRTGVRHHQVGARLPAVPAARSRQGPRRVEPGHHGLQSEAAVRPRRRHLTRKPERAVMARGRDNTIQASERQSQRRTDPGARAPPKARLHPPYQHRQARSLRTQVRRAARGGQQPDPVHDTITPGTTTPPPTKSRWPARYAI